MTAPSVKGWCPGALRPMASGDGLVVRLRFTAGRLPAAIAAALADMARRHGNGLVDLTLRGNLQLRGVTNATLPALHADLAALGLLDADAGAEARRNLVVSPLAGAATLALAEALEAALAAAVELATLPAKFAFLLDDGTWPRPAGLGFDIAFVRREDGWCVDLPSASGSLDLATVEAARIPATAVRLAAGFLAGRGGARRMADLTADPAWIHRLAASAGLAARPTSQPAPTLPEVIGRQAGALGVGVPFGQMEAPALAALADIAACHANGDIRLTPFRAVLLPAVADAETAEAALAAAGFITDPADPRRAVVVCTGAPGCASGLQPARRDAALLAPLARALGPGLQLHVSGCAKGCARPSATPVTLVGTGRGYDLVLDGKPGDRPRTKGLTRADLAAALARLERP